ncbi:MAG TPA: alpha/beta fold hydrolase [Candidatus Saccharimonadales bacterium]|nr:alpha/beta fold hydrolase [Candidatus Saccharimonadales bacterium]
MAELTHDGGETNGNGNGLMRMPSRPNPAVPPNGRPIRKDEIELAERGLYIESWLPERRSRRKPLLFLHGELGGSWLWERYLAFFASRGWECHALNLRNHFWSQTADPATLTFESYVADVLAALDRLGPETVAVGHGLGGLLAMKAAERHRPNALILISPELPAELRTPARPFELNQVPDVYGKARIGWSTLPEKLQRDHRDLTLNDVLRIQHLLGQKAHESGSARRQVMRGVRVDRAAMAGIPKLVVGAGLDRQRPEAESLRLADWLGADYEPFAAHSHYGLVLGEESYLQVAEAIRAFLEANRL